MTAVKGEAMETERFLELAHTAERLKDVERHSFTSGGRRESVAEHCWRISFLALFMRDEFPEVDMDKVVRMCLVHDMGEAFTGDIPAFVKTDSDERRERALLKEWVSGLPAPYCDEFMALYGEMAAMETQEARLFKALDGIEAVIQHNESDIGTWSDVEYALNIVYADDKVAFSPYLTRLRERIRLETRRKLEGRE